MGKTKKQQGENRLKCTEQLEKRRKEEQKSKKESWILQAVGMKGKLKREGVDENQGEKKNRKETRRNG